MGNVVYMNQFSNKGLDVSVLERNKRRVDAGLLTPAKEEVIDDIVVDHSAEPIKSLDDINDITKFLVGNGRYRDNMLFIIGINFGLRVSDLRMIRFCDLITENMVFKERIPVFERKTRNTRNKKRNRYITINDAVIESVLLYLRNTPNVSLSDFLFPSESNNKSDEPLTRQSIDRILKSIAKDVGLGIRMSTHTLRKTFCYHQMLMSHNDTRKLLLLQKMLNHSSPMQTLEYIGITAEEIDDAYKSLNLGSSKYNYLVNSSIVEFESSAM